MLMVLARSISRTAIKLLRTRLQILLRFLSGHRSVGHIGLPSSQELFLQYALQ